VPTEYASLEFCFLKKTTQGCLLPLALCASTVPLMRVKRLEIQGFKSFKDKTVIHFDHLITGIVGPNGCGKSNIVDAFFWVMGEQSYKHMRGSGSSDLIFNGSSRYSPLGMAEATLVMEHSVPDLESGPAGASAEDTPVKLKTKEVSVTRRLYRSGEGEYFINGVPARLKDIHELFMDTGIGAKGYAVIEQGQIGKIVQAKPEERRLLIEEAAGIAKYKARKKESLRKMESAQGNLSRLNDVIQEIERSLGSLERQAQKARQYEKYRSELFEKEVTWGRRKAQVLSAKIETARSQRDALEQELVGLRAELQTAENSIETERVDQVTDSKLVEDLQTKIQALSEELHQQKSALELSRRRQGDLDEQLRSMEQEREDLQTAIETEHEKIASRESEAQEAEDAHRIAAEQSEIFQDDIRDLRVAYESGRNQLDQTKRSLMAGISQASDLQSQAASLNSRVESQKMQLERLESQKSQLAEKLEETRGEAESLRTQQEESQSQRSDLQNEKRELSSRTQSLDQNLRQAERTRDESSKKLTQLRSKLQSLEELDQAHEGFSDGPKAALDWAKKNGKKDEIRALADLLTIDAGFEGALEGWLESRLESLYSQSPESAGHALDAIRQGKRGRAAVLLAHQSSAAQIKHWNLDDARNSLSKLGVEVQSLLTDGVHLKQGHEASLRLDAIIGNIAVVESSTLLFTHALEMLQAAPGLHFVSRDGVALSSSGELRGGSIQSDASASLLGRKRAIAELSTQVTESETHLAGLEETVEGARAEVETARERLSEVQAELQALEIRCAALDRDVHQVNRSLRELESQASNSDREIEDLTARVQSGTGEQERLQEKLEEILSGRQEVEEQIQALEEQVQERESALREKESEFQSLKVAEASSRERAQSLKRELEGSKSVLNDRQRRLNEVNRTLERASREQEEHSGGDGDLKIRIEILTRNLATNQEALATVKDRLEQSNSKLKTALSRIKELHDSGDKKTSVSNQLSLEIEKNNGELSHLVLNLEEKYGTGCLNSPEAAPIQEEMTEPVVTREMTAEEEQLLFEEVERLRDRIRRLGEVNPGAVKEFEEVSKRYEYLTVEKKDLVTSIKNLEEAIEHINKTSEERFRKAFEAIANRFQKLFPIIFGGGQAKLSLVYPEGSTDILEAGVDILAQPPGKKVVNIGLLSGGEKALTAVSLIFAIFMVKPSPFCLLDEVDAPLDDANIGKFNALLREMSAKSQFIIITHNKKTMELNDTLYGVTMEEPGVSKLVSIEMQ
jgi:chromosome segregation protein